MWHALRELAVGAVFFAPFAGIPLLAFRLLSHRLEAWLLGAVSGLVVCGYSLAACSLGATGVSGIVSLFFFASTALVAVPVGLLDSLLPGGGLLRVGEWTYIVIPIALLFGIYAAIGLVAGSIVGAVRRAP